MKPYSISFASRPMTLTEKNYSVQEMEALAIYWGIKNFRPCLESNDDHKDSTDSCTTPYGCDLVLPR
jgi:hypothetical protein